MSYISTSVLAASTTVAQVRDIVCLLGYEKVSERLKVPHLVGSYFWYDETDFRSWAGVELHIFKPAKGPVEVETRSTASRSYWDLVHQNRTLKLFRDLFAGHFETDAGKNRYWRPEANPPTPLSSGCYLARWRFNNNIMRAKNYLMHRKLEGPIAKDRPSGLSYLDEINPRLLSNNLVIPYVIAVWEEYFRGTFLACLRYSAHKERALKKAKLSYSHLEKLVIGATQIDRALVESFPLQRPSSIAEAFKLLDPGLDIAGPLRKPYRGRKETLFDSIESLVEDRNLLVHTGEINVKLFDSHLQRVLSDLTEAVDRSYNHIAKHNGFNPNRDY
jgi:hypothetical protein